MNRVFFQVAILIGLLPAGVGATSLRLCLDNPAAVSVATRAEFQMELTRLFPGMAFGSEAACADDEEAVRIALAKEAADHPADVLGAIRIQPDGRLELPALVFVDTVAAYSKAPGQQALGRALARVAGHELLHYFQQSAEHAAHGLMQHRLSAQDLTRHPQPPNWLMSARFKH